MVKFIGIAIAACTHGLFAWTVWWLFWFLRADEARSLHGNLWVDALLSLQFGVIHSPLLLPAVRRWLTERLIPSAFYGCFFCVATCLSLLLAIWWWQPCGPVIWDLTGWPRVVVQACFIGSWPALIYSLSLTGLGYQTGWTPWWHWFRGRPAPRRDFQVIGAYRWLRHPIYLSFLGLI